ncbi:acyl-CoA dehydrogenase family protein [Halioglobus pacificus]|uniref:Acyl-CoA dehydrogenase n=1 Tax=Parahalioglobus pacificus TaxID=930806 RepID=A0A919CMN5_9GAMM|nr:acyl-CoA dehydrogenase family protein [Halioglobus pacificus]GHD37957.1 acyl-CoA dehydrogenase [Halioglobus pacificus]
MEFSFTEEQQMIRDTARSFLAEVSSSAAVRGVMGSELGYDPDLWQRVCKELYWPAMHIPEAYGGLGLGYVELVATLEEMGKHLFCSPFFSTVCLGANAVLLAGTETQKQQILPQLIDGVTASVAYTGASRRSDCASVEGIWERTADGYRLDGYWRYIPNGHSADVLIVAARTPFSTGPDGISLFVVPSDTPGLERNYLPTMDETRKQAEVYLRDVFLPEDALLGEADQAGQSGECLEKLIALAAIAVAADQVGVAQESLDSSVAYMQERVQFGRVIASYQALKHKAADMMLKAEAARSALYYAACVADEALRGGPLGEELLEAASIAKAYCSDAAFFNAGCGIQLHGGVGFTEEYDIQLFFKRAKSAETLLGNAAWHREIIASQLLDGEVMGL